MTSDWFIGGARLYFGATTSTSTGIIRFLQFSAKVPAKESKPSMKMDLRGGIEGIEAENESILE